MSNFPPPNPYSTPSYPTAPYGLPPSSNSSSNAKIIVPGVMMTVIGSLGMILTIVSLILAFRDPPPVDPNLPELVNEFRRAGYGPLAIAIQSVFFVVNLFIISGGFMMTQLKAWPLCLAASLLSMVNFGNCCCVLGLPVGIWAVIVLSMDDVRRKFKQI